MRVARFRWLLLILGIALVCIVSVVAFSGPRSAFVRTALALFLKTKGFELNQADLALGGGQLNVNHLIITESGGAPFVSADSIHVAYQLHGSALSIRTIRVERPVLTLRKSEDGSFNFSRLSGPPASNASPAPVSAQANQSAPLHLTLSVHDGKVNLENRYAPARPGRFFSIDHIDIGAHIDQARTSQGELHALLDSGGRSRPLHASFFENDIARVAELRANAADVALAPILDLLVSATAFTVEKGSADISLRAYALGWSPHSLPDWHVSATGQLREGRLRVFPLITPVRDINGPMSFYDGSLIFPKLSGSAARTPLIASGVILVNPSVNLNLTIASAGRLERVRNLLAVLKPLPLKGNVRLITRVSGAPNDPLVAVDFTLPHGLHYARMPISSAAGSLVYNAKHVSIPGATARYAGFHVAGNGDIDLSASATPVGRFVVAMRGPSASIPWLANLEKTGLVSGHALLQGPIAKLQGDGFLQLQGRALKIRTTFSGGIDSFTLGPLVALDRRGGSLWLAAKVDRLHDYTTDAHLIAHNFALNLNGRHTRLPGIFETPYGMPAASGVFNGVISLNGPLIGPSFSADMHGRQLTMAGTRYGNLDLAAAGFSGGAHLLSLAVTGPVIRLHVVGDLDRNQSDGALHGDVRGSTVANLSAFSQYAPLAGHANASFSARFGNHDLLGEARVRKSNARIAGVPVQSADVILGIHKRSLRVYAATAAFAGGKAIGSGELPASSREKQNLNLAVSNIQLQELRVAGVPLTQGEVVAFGHISGTREHPAAALSGVLTNGSIAGRDLNADAQVDYNGRSLSSSGSRILIGKSTAVDVQGTVSGLGPGLALQSAGLHMTAAIHDADLGELAPFQMGGMPLLTGSVDGVLAVSGSVAAPYASGEITSDVGSVHGITYENLKATIAGGASGVNVGSAHMLVGSSELSMAGSLSPQQTSLHLQSPHMDLSDFNDFFNGKDVLSGVGAANIALATSSTSSSANGYLHLRDAIIAGVPLGSVHGRFTTRRGTIQADILQRNQLAAARIRGAVAFPKHVGMLPDFRNAVLDATASARNLDIAMLAPLLPSRAEGIRGKLDFDATANGTLVRLSSRARFNLKGGYVRKDPINELNGTVTSGRSGISIPTLRAGINGATLIARGTYGYDGRIRGRAVVAARDIASVTRVANIQSPLHGAATLAVDAVGTLQRPLVDALFSAAPGNLYGVGYDGMDVDASYAPGSVRLRNAGVRLSHRGGVLAASGTIPIPFGPQPPHTNRFAGRVMLQVTASGVDLAAFNPALHEQASLGGRFDADARAQGSLAKPTLAGKASLRNVSVRAKLETIPLTALNADVAFSNDGIRMPNLHGKLGSGTIDASASGRLIPPSARNPLGGVSYAMRLLTDRANLNVPHFFSGAVSANLNLQSNGIKPLLAGDVTFSHTDVPFAGILALAAGSSSGAPPQAAQIPGVPPLRKGHSISYAGNVYGGEARLVQPTPQPLKRHVPPSSAIALDINANAGKDVAISGLVDATGEGSVHVGGDASSPKLNGTLNAIRGQVGVFDTVFHLLRGSVSFDPADGLLPTVEAQAIAYRPEADVTVTVGGRVDQLHTALQSDPFMSQAAILSYLLHINQINNALTGGGSASAPGLGIGNAGGAVQNFAGAALTGKLLSAINYGLEQNLNISEVNFAFDARGQPNMELRKRYGKNLYALFRTSFQAPPQQSVGVAYTLRDALEMDLVQKQNASAQNPFDLTQITTLQVNIKFPNVAHRSLERPKKPGPR